MDHSAISASVFDKHAERYRDKYMHLSLYDDSYREFCEALRPGRVRVLDAACGPGMVSRYLLAHKPELDLVGIDLAPRMVELARATVPLAHFAVHDCRRLADLEWPFGGIICAFGLPYFSKEEAAGFIKTANQALEPGGILYLSTMLGESSGLERFSTGEEVYVTYYNEEELLSALRTCGFEILKQNRIASPSTAPKPTTDLIVIGRK